MVVKGGYRCGCPDGQSPIGLSNSQCTSAFETPLPEMHRCECKNGASCIFKNDQIICDCRNNYEGTHCEDHITKSPTAAANSSTFISLIAIALIGTLGYLMYRTFKKKQVKSGFNGNQSVSFHNGTNVEFSTVCFIYQVCFHSFNHELFFSPHSGTRISW